MTLISPPCGYCGKFGCTGLCQFVDLSGTGKWTVTTTPAVMISREDNWVVLHNGQAKGFKQKQDAVKFAEERALAGEQVALCEVTCWCNATPQWVDR